MNRYLVHIVFTWKSQKLHRAFWQVLVEERIDSTERKISKKTQKRKSFNKTQKTQNSKSFKYTKSSRYSELSLLVWLLILVGDQQIRYRSFTRVTDRTFLSRWLVKNVRSRSFLVSKRSSRRMQKFQVVCWPEVQTNYETRLVDSEKMAKILNSK